MAHHPQALSIVATPAAAAAGAHAVLLHSLLMALSSIFLQGLLLHSYTRHSCVPFCMMGHWPSTVCRVLMLYSSRTSFKSSRYSAVQSVCWPALSFIMMLCYSLPELVFTSCEVVKISPPQDSPSFSALKYFYKTRKILYTPRSKSQLLFLALYPGV